MARYSTNNSIYQHETEQRCEIKEVKFLVIKTSNLLFLCSLRNKLKISEIWWTRFIIIKTESRIKQTITSTFLCEFFVINNIYCLVKILSELSISSIWSHFQLLTTGHDIRPEIFRLNLSKHNVLLIWKKSYKRNNLPH